MKITYKNIFFKLHLQKTKTTDMILPVVFVILFFLILHKTHKTHEKE